MLPCRHGREARSYGLAAQGRSGSKDVSMDEVVGHTAGQPEVTSPPPRSISLQLPHQTPQAGRAFPGSDALLLSSPFAAWKQQGFDQDSQPSGSARGRQVLEEICQLATPHGAGGDSGEDAGDNAEEACALENDENINWLVSPVRPPRKSAPPALQTPEKEGLLTIQPMPSLSSWMVPAAKPPPRPDAPPSALAAAMEDVVGNISFSAAAPRKLAGPPSPLERLLGEIGDSDWAPSVALWDREQQES
jgi:hypothetical protein